MPISREDFDRLEELSRVINESLQEVEKIIKDATMGPCLSEVVESLSGDIEEEINNDGEDNV